MAFRAPAKFEIYYDRELVNKVKKGISDFLFGPVGAQTKYQKRKINYLCLFLGTVPSVSL